MCESIALTQCKIQLGVGRNLVKGEQASEPWMHLTNWVANAATWYQYASAVATYVILLEQACFVVHIAICVC